MSKIIWKGIIKSEKDFPVARPGEIPKSARILDSGEDLTSLQFKALPFLFPLIFICLACLFLKTFLADARVISLPFLFLGVVIGFFLIIIHELLHAIAPEIRHRLYRHRSAIPRARCPFRQPRVPQSFHLHQYSPHPPRHHPAYRFLLHE